MNICFWGLFLLLTTTVLEERALFASSKVCVAALSIFDNEKEDNALHADIQSTTEKLLKEMGYHHPRDLFIYKHGSPRGIKDCLEGMYEDVIIIAHTMEKPENFHSIVYRAKMKNKKGEDIEGWIILDGHLFKNINVQKTLRQITLIGCNSKEVLENYASLRTLAQKNNIYVKFQPMSIRHSIARADIGIRHEDLFAYMIAESAQDETAKKIRCLIRTNVGILYEYGFSSCLRNRYHINFHGPLTVGLRTSIKWLGLSIDPQCNSQGECNVLDVELGYLRGLNVRASLDPLEFTHESFGVSVSPFQYISVTKNP